MNDDPASLNRELAKLRAENARLSASAAVQGLRAAGQGGEAHALRQQIRLVQESFFWRLTWPLRLGVDIARGLPPTASADGLRLRRAIGVAKREGSAGLWRMWQRRQRFRARITESHPHEPQNTSRTAPPPDTLLAPNVLIVAELSLQQCAKYRVWQKQEHFARLGMPCRVVDWRRTDDVLSAAATATLVILYRVPGYPETLRIIAAMRSLGLRLGWEVDDIIFDDALFLQNRNVDSLEPKLREEILSGVKLYRAAMLACDFGIASTPHLANAMQAAGLTETIVVENALDAETLSIAATLRTKRQAQHPPANRLITYGSGTKTHNADFLEAAPALLRVLQTRMDVKLRIVGELTLPETFAAIAERIERLPPMPFTQYLACLAESDVSIAPLENTPFNDAKSNIKFLEAAILGIPSVCSPRAHFRDVIADGTNALLAESEQSWFAALTALLDDPERRARIGAAALQTALSRYAPDALAHAQMPPLLPPDHRKPAKLRVLFANIYYAPRSYGGATLVVEEMSRHLKAQDVDVHIYTGLPHKTPDRALTRSDQDGITVFATPTSDSDMVGAFDDPEAADRFGRVLDAVQPHVVHLHALQGLTASLAAACCARGIPYVITLHDAWWLCARQFMVREDGTYCFQKSIDLRICQNCMPGAFHLEHRWRLMQSALRGAALLISPSESHRQLHLANGIAEDRIVVAPNGVRLPTSHIPRTTTESLRFAYVGGNVDVKGHHIVKRAFESLSRPDWQLILVDNTLNLGFSSVEAAEWNVQGQIRIVPAYRQDDLDAFFAGVDVLVFPSQWKESFGLTVREALARDVWVIATDGGGPAEAIAHGVNGTLIPLDGRSEPLRAAVEALLDRPDRLANHRNPHAAEIIGYTTQATALHDILQRVAGQEPKDGR